MQNRPTKHIDSLWYLGLNAFFDNNLFFYLFTRLLLNVHVDIEMNARVAVGRC